MEKTREYTFLDRSTVDQISVTAFSLALLINGFFEDGNAYLDQVEKAIKQNVYIALPPSFILMKDILPVEERMIFFQTIIFEELITLLKNEERGELLAQFLAMYGNAFALDIKNLKSFIKIHPVGSKTHASYSLFLTDAILKYNNNRPFLNHSALAIHEDVKNIVLDTTQIRALLRISLLETVAPLRVMIERNDRFVSEGPIV